MRLIRLWFTDILGNLKSFAISPAELENALERRDDVRRLVDRRLLAHPGGRRAGDPRPRHVRGAAVGRPQGARGAGVLRHPQPRRHAVRRRSAARCCAATCAPPTTEGFTFYVAPDIEFFYFEPPEPGQRPQSARRGRLLRPHHQRRHRVAAQADDPHARGDGHPGRVQLPRGRPEPAGDRPAPHRRADDGRQRDDVPARRPRGRRVARRCTPRSCPSRSRACRARACTPTCRCSAATTTPSSTTTTTTTCRRSPSRSWPACCATPPRSRRSPTRRSTATSGWCPASRRRCTCRGPATTAAG